MGLTTNRHLTLFHRFQQGGLHLGRGPVDLIGQNDVGKDGTGFEAKDAARFGLNVNIRAGHVRREQVWCELYPAELGLKVFGHRLDRACLGQARQTFDQKVTIGEQPDHEPLNNSSLSNDRFGHAFAKVIDGVSSSHNVPKINYGWAHTVTLNGFRSIKTSAKTYYREAFSRARKTATTSLMSGLSCPWRGASDSVVNQ